MPYRFYLIGRDGLIYAAEYFGAWDDAEALDVAASLHQACSDAFPDYELWHGQERVRSRRSRWNYKDLSQLRSEVQQLIADVEDLLEHDFRISKTSQQYAEKHAELRVRFPDLSPSPSKSGAFHVPQIKRLETAAIPATRSLEPEQLIGPQHVD